MANKPNPFDTMSKARKDEQEQLVDKAKNTATEPKKKATPKPKQTEQTRGKGRPCIDENKGKKKDYCKTINIAVPKDKIELINDYALQGRGVNLTEYVNLLISKDLEKNLEKYKKEISRTVDFD